MGRTEEVARVDGEAEVPFGCYVLLKDLRISSSVHRAPNGGEAKRLEYNYKKRAP